MNKNYILYIVLLITIGISSCEDMNELHNVYLENGEIDYVGKVDSAYALGGDGRIKFEYWITDPRATSLHIKWNQGSEMVETVAVPTHEANEKLEYTLGVNTALTEKSHTFTFVTESDAGVKSVNFEVLGNVYGDMYKQSLTTRNLAESNYDGENLNLLFGTQTTEDNTGIKLFYTNLAGENMEVSYSNDNLSEGIAIGDIDVTKGASYTTSYLPEENVIDTFYTVSTAIEIIQSVNVALNKPTTFSSQLNDSYGGANAVDGIIGLNESRWINARSVGFEHWIVVDLEQEYDVDKIIVYDDTPSENFKLQVEVNGEWVDVASESANAQKVYQAEFPAVTTSKVRYFVTVTAEDVLVRLFEIEIISTIKY